MEEYNVYIDESGDEGIRKGSKYFILTALIVKKNDDLNISRIVDLIKVNLEMSITSQLHWKLIKGYPNKQMIMKEVSKIGITLINIIVDTSKINILHSIDIYNYFTGYLYERICLLMRDSKGKANIKISSRGNLSKNNLINFLKGKNYNKFKIDYNYINGIKIYPNSQKKLLQLADCCCSALGQALTYNNETHHMYIGYLIDKFYSYKGKYIGYGLKYVPGISFSNEYSDLIAYLESIKKE